MKPSSPSSSCHCLSSPLQQKQGGEDKERDTNVNKGKKIESRTVGEAYKGNAWMPSGNCPLCMTAPEAGRRGREKLALCAQRETTSHTNISPPPSPPPLVVLSFDFFLYYSRLHLHIQVHAPSTSPSYLPSLARHPTTTTNVSLGAKRVGEEGRRKAGV